MRSYELKPTHDNLLNTFLEDMLDRNKEIFIFADMLNSCSKAYSMAIDASWGNGKTFFVKQTKMYLDAHNPHLKSISDEDREAIKSVKYNNALQPQISVYYDAWENDNDTDPILSLVYSIVNSVEIDYSFEQGSSIFEKAAKILEFFNGRNWSDLINVFKSSTVLDEIKQGKNIEMEIKDFLDSLLSERGNRLIVFIDELDRCKPSYAIKLLERIKHYFDNDKITFVFSINAKELQNTIKKHYGNDFDACRYLDRFFDIRPSLSPIDLSKYFDSIKFNSNYIYDEICELVINRYKFSIREIGKYLSMTRIAAYSPTHKSYYSDFPEEKSQQFCMFYVVPIMLGLNLYNRDKYESFIAGQDAKPLIEILSEYLLQRFDDLLEKDEAYQEVENKKIVTLDDKLNLVYNALFNHSYATQNTSIKIGQYIFNSKTKRVLFEVVGLLSEYATIEADVDYSI